MKWIVCAVICAVLLIPSAVAEERKEIEQQSVQTLENKILTLRTSYSDANLKFNSQGQLLGTSKILPWTTHGVLYVKKLRLTEKSLEIEGQRAILLYAFGKGNGFAPVVSTQKVHVTIELVSPLIATQVNQALLVRLYGG